MFDSRSCCVCSYRSSFILVNMIPYNLFLDDFRNPSDCLNYSHKYMPKDKSIYRQSWVTARSHEDFIRIIKATFDCGLFPERVSFDHDLSEDHYSETFNNCPELYDTCQEKTGNHSAKWLVKFCIDNNIDLPKCYVHSMNPSGSERIWESLKDWQRHLNPI